MSDNPTTMEAGPELDRLVAELVMGWVFIDGSENMMFPDCYHSDERGKVALAEFQPSKRIAHAWDVVEKITTPSNERGAYGFPPSSHFAYWWARQDLWAYSASEAALHICRAALLAVQQKATP
jgi:hypothetical protein